MPCFIDIHGRPAPFSTEMQEWMGQHKGEVEEEMEGRERRETVVRVQNT